MKKSLLFFTILIVWITVLKGQKSTDRYYLTYARMDNTESPDTIISTSYRLIGILRVTKDKAHLFEARRDFKYSKKLSLAYKYKIDTVNGIPQLKSRKDARNNRYITELNPAKTGLTRPDTIADLALLYLPEGQPINLESQLQGDGLTGRKTEGNAVFSLERYPYDIPPFSSQDKLLLFQTDVLDNKQVGLPAFQYEFKVRNRRFYGIYSLMTDALLFTQTTPQREHALIIANTGIIEKTPALETVLLDTRTFSGNQFESSQLHGVWTCHSIPSEGSTMPAIGAKIENDEEESVLTGISDLNAELTFQPDGTYLYKEGFVYRKEQNFSESEGRWQLNRSGEFIFLENIKGLLPGNVKFHLVSGQLVLEFHKPSGTPDLYPVLMLEFQKVR